jgi:glutamate dehydrogenase
MSNNNDSKKQKLVDQIVRTTRRGAGKRAGDVERFTRLFFANVSPLDCAETEDNCLRGAVSSLWQFAQNRKPGAAKICVFNPDRKKDGWSCGRRNRQ